MKKIIRVNFSLNILVEINDPQKEEFTDKVLNEFDKIYLNQLNRVEKFFKKDKTLSTKNSYSHKKNSVEKNYYEWKPKQGNDIWAETLRGRNNSVKNIDRKEKNLKSSIIVDDNEKHHLENQIEKTKEKIKNSIKFTNNIPISPSVENSFILNKSQSTKNNIGKNDAFKNNNSSKILSLENEFNNNNNNPNINSNIKLNYYNDKNNNQNTKNKTNFQFGLVGGISKSISEKDMNISQSPNRSREKIMSAKKDIMRK